MPDLPSWDELDLPVLDEVVDESAVPVLAEEVLDVPDFDFSSELDVMQQSLVPPGHGMAELEIPELTLEDLDVASPAVAPAAAALDLTALPSLDLDEPLADELSLQQVLPDEQPPAAQAAGVSLVLQPEAPVMAVDGFEFMLDSHAPAASVPDSQPEPSWPVAASGESPLSDLAAPQQLAERLAQVWQIPVEPPVTVDDAVPSAPSVESPPALPSGLSISLDSLPDGVLGGGVGKVEEARPSAAELLARAQALVAATPSSLDEVLHAAELTLAQEESLQRFHAAPAAAQHTFASLGEAELQAAMAGLPGIVAADNQEEDWPSLGDVDRLNETELELPEEAAVQAAAPLLQAEWQDEPPEHATPDNAVALPVLEQEEGWPSLGDVDRLNETEVELPDEAAVMAAASLLQAEWQDEPPEHAAPDSAVALPVLEQEEDWPSVGEVDKESETEGDGEPEVPAAKPAVSTVQGLFAESPFASERQPTAQVDMPVIPDLPDEVPALPEQAPEPALLPAVAQVVEPPLLEELAGASFAAAMPQTVAQPIEDAGKAVEVLNVAAVTTATAATALMNPLRKPDATVAVVDERALVEAMYEKLLPRMKVELSLWLQDALELQAKNMLSGVMQQLKEDYDMLFGETLKESLRQAILALGREQQGPHDAPRGEQD
ncbi:hypothetical protein [Aquitalea aquatilis]|uniref:hypothetical protein n=1 Tax=Aquitalea aquatilis TaxID=1537400 RepID=UPI0010BE04B9|nr:hypothetical protein [Aquitalea aquatilis]